MSGTTSFTPMRVNDLLNRLKLLPGDMRIEINNPLGRFYLQDLEIDALDNCISNLILIEIPEEIDEPELIEEE